jgi:hypothetical protein
VDERRNMINDHLRGRACIVALRVLGGVDFRGSIEFSDFEIFFALFLGLPLFVPFVGVVVFPSSR